MNEPPCKNCLTYAICRNTIVSNWNHADWDRDVRLNIIYETLLMISLKFCYLFRQYTKYDHYNDPTTGEVFPIKYDSKKSLPLVEVFRLQELIDHDVYL